MVQLSLVGISNAKIKRALPRGVFEMPSQDGQIKFEAQRNRRIPHALLGQLILPWKMSDPLDLRLSYARFPLVHDLDVIW